MFGRLLKFKVKIYMRDEDEELEDGFRLGADEDEPLDMPAEEMTDFGLDEEDPDKDR